MSFINWKLDRLVETGFRLWVLVCVHFMLQTVRGVSEVPRTLREVLTKLKLEESYTVCTFSETLFGVVSALTI